MRIKHLGFGLIEVMVAVAVIGVGVTGLVVLQKSFLRSSNESVYRSVAMELAKAKMEEFRDFDDVTGGTNNFLDIATGNDSVTVNGQAYSRLWNVSNLYYNQATSSWSGTAPTGVLGPDQKQVAITVSWTSPQGTDTVTLNGSMSASTSADKKNSLDPVFNTDGPKVAYTPGQAPDVIALELNTNGTGKKRESSKPIPEVLKQGGSTLVKFDTVTYKPDSTTLIREDYATINCECSLSNPKTQGYTPFVSRPDATDIDDYQVIVEDGALVAKSTGAPTNNNPSAYCTICCQDHFDSNDSSKPVFDPARLITPHGHYMYTGSAYNTFNASLVTSASFTSILAGNYLEACRMQRIDGYYRVTQDWRLVDVVLMRKDWLESSSNQAAYRNYVLAKIKDQILGTTAADKTALRDVSPSGLQVANAGATQLMARGIYLDYLNAADLSLLQSLVDTDENWPALVPFYDLNLTLLADWKVTSGTGMTVTNQAIKTLDPDPSANYYGTYSRGLLTVSSGGNGTVAVRARLGNTGVTGSSPTDLSDGNQYLEDSLSVTIAGAGLAVSGTLNCLQKNGTNTKACNGSIPGGVTVIAKVNGVADNSITCGVTTPNGNGTPAYSCSGFSATWAGSISFSYSAGGFTFSPASFAVDFGTGTATGQCVLMYESSISPAPASCT